tara:strand:+ start:456 stop:602 length:147 start_codon:yes stop_codon:yes gene_type:complete
MIIKMKFLCMVKLKKFPLIYELDGKLAGMNRQEASFIPTIGMNAHLQI